MTNTNGVYQSGAVQAAVSQLGIELNKEKIDEMCSPATTATEDFAMKAQQYSAQATQAYVSAGVPKGIRGFIINYVTDPLGLSSPEGRWKSRQSLIAKDSAKAERIAEKGSKHLEDLCKMGDVLRDKYQKVSVAHAQYGKMNAVAMEDQAKLEADYKSAYDELDVLAEMDAAKPDLLARIRGIESEMSKLSSDKQKLLYDWDRLRNAVTEHGDGIKNIERQQYKTEILLMQVNAYRSMLEREKNKLNPYVIPQEGLSETDVVVFIGEAQKHLVGSNGDYKDAIAEIDKNKDAAMTEIQKINVDCTDEEDTVTAQLRTQSHEMRQKAIARITKEQKKVRRF